MYKFAWIRVLQYTYYLILPTVYEINFVWKFCFTNLSKNKCFIKTAYKYNEMLHTKILGVNNIEKENSGISINVLLI